MRILLATLAIFVAASALPGTAKADPYRWCANYGGKNGGMSNCYFMTIEQCRAAISGVGGWCGPNPFYDGQPVTTPEDRIVPHRRRH